MEEYSNSGRIINIKIDFLVFHFIIILKIQLIIIMIASDFARFLATLAQTPSRTQNSEFTIESTTHNGARVRINENLIVSIVVPFDCDCVETILIRNDQMDHDSMTRHDSLDSEDFPSLLSYLRNPEA